MTGGTQLDVQAIVPCNAHQYYIERDSAAFRALIAKALNLGVYKFRDTWKQGGSTFVRLVTKPEISSWVPSAVRNAVANASEIEFHDIIEYRPSETSGPSYTLHVRTESPFLGDKLRVHTTLELTPLTDNTTLQHLSGTVCVRMFGMSGLIEKAIRDNMVKTYRQLPEIVSRWEAYRAEFVKNGDAGVLLAGRPPVGGDLEYARSIMQAPLILKESTLPLNGATSPTKAQLLAAAEKEKAELSTGAVQQEEGGGTALLENENDNNENVINSILTDRYISPQKTQAEETLSLPSVPRHTRRRTASSLILDALPSLDLPSEHNLNLHNSTQQKHSLSAPVAPRHWRGFSWDSVGSQGAEAPTELEERRPGSKGAYTAWRRFNRDYVVWETYWAQIGVHAATAAQQGVVRIFQIVLAELAAVGRLLAIVLLLLLVRLNILSVDCSVSRINKTTSTVPNYHQQHQQKRSSRSVRTSSVENAETAPPLAGATGAVDMVEHEQHEDKDSSIAGGSFNDDMRQRNNDYRWFSLKKSSTF